MNMVMQFLKEVRAELARVEWPKINEFIGSTMVVFVLIVISALFLGGVDRVIAWSVKNILSTVF
jgi:preprotein translocase subunit SecE